MGLILHFGLGNFARAHLLDYTADAGSWEVTGVSLRSAAVRDGLRMQGFSYDLYVHGVGAKRIEVLRDVLVAPEDPGAVLAAMTEADIISLTVTEKGYHLDSEGKLDLNDPAILADLEGEGPRTPIGFLSQGLAACSRPVTVLSCDNLVGNGALLRAAVVRFAQKAGLAIDFDRVSFPKAMVDRITPATTDVLRAARGDPMAVPTEAFREWVIEDDFAGLRPDWPGVQFVTNVGPHELRKLRMLNGAHSLMAYAGLLRGLRYVHEAVREPQLRALVVQLMAEAGATLPQEVQPQVPSYAQALLNRFENPEMAHRLDQIAMDGSQKVPHRFVGTLRAGRAPALVAGLRAWVDFCIAEARRGRTLNDPMSKQIAKAALGKDPVAGILALVGAADLRTLIEV